MAVSGCDPGQCPKHLTGPLVYHFNLVTATLDIGMYEPGFEGLLQLFTHMVPAAPGNQPCLIRQMIQKLRQPGGPSGLLEPGRHAGCQGLGGDPLVRRLYEQAHALLRQHRRAKMIGTAKQATFSGSVE